MKAREQALLDAFSNNAKSRHSPGVRRIFLPFGRTRTGGNKTYPRVDKGRGGITKILLATSRETGWIFPGQGIV